MSASSRRSIIILLIAMPLVASLSACEPAPRPFHTELPPPETLALLKPRASSGVLVAPTQGLSPSVSRRFDEFLAEELQGRDVPASARTGGTQTYILHSQANISNLDALEVDLELVWTLTDPKGISLGSTKILEKIPGNAWREESETLLARLAKRAAPPVEALIRGETEPKNQLITGKIGNGPIRVVIQPIAPPAPGDSATSLVRALRAALFRNNIAVLRETTEETFVIAGAVRLKELGSQEEVSIEWSVLDPKGKVIGNINQGNIVPKGQLSGPWGDVATAVAEGGAIGIAQLLRTVTAEVVERPKK